MTISLPSAESWAEAQVYGQVMWLERKAIENGVVFDYEYAYCHRYCRPEGQDARAEIAHSVGGSHMVDIKAEGAWSIPLVYKEALDLVYRQYERMGRFINQSVPEYVIGNLQLDATRAKAADGTLRSRLDDPSGRDQDLSWYWDNSVNAQAGPCPAGSDVRRCLRFEPDVRIRASDWLTIGGRTDKLQSYKELWKATSGVRWTDGMTTKGRVYDGQEFTLEEGRDVVNGFMEKVESILSSTAMPGVDADVRTTYDWVMGAGGVQSLAYFVQPGSPSVC